MTPPTYLLLFFAAAGMLVCMGTGSKNTFLENEIRHRVQCPAAPQLITNQPQAELLHKYEPLWEQVEKMRDDFAEESKTSLVCKNYCCCFFAGQTQKVCPPYCPSEEGRGGRGRLAYCCGAYALFCAERVAWALCCFP